MNRTLRLANRAFIAKLPVGGGIGKWDAVMEELRAARDLADDWDGQGAKAPTADAADAALTMAGELRGADVAPPDDFGPAPNGVIVLGWHTATTSADIEFDSAGRAVGSYWTRGDKRAEPFPFVTDE